MATFGERIANFFNGNDAETHEGLRGLFVNEIKNIYYAEKIGIDGMGESADAATTDEVRNAFLQHQQESRQHVARLEQVLQSINESVDEGNCEAADGLAADTRTVISNTESGSLTRDAGLIIAGQKGEHHEIASYGSAVTLAKVLGYSQAAQLLHQTLEEEKATDHKFTQLAESFVNNRAASEGNDNPTNGNGNSSFGSSDQYSTATTQSTQYSDSGSTGQTYQSGQSYSGPQTGSPSVGGSSYGSSNDATLGGTLGI